MSADLPVLGLFKDEHALRDHLADHLDLVEDDLRLLAKEYGISNPDGANGKVDILARDELGHLVVIELKRSDKSARTTLNELSKYTALLVKRDRVARELIRCIVVSTDWHELLLPLSYFATTSGVDVQAKEVTCGQNGTLEIHPKALVPIRFLPQFSPEISIYNYLSAQDRELHLSEVRRRSTEATFVRLALLVLAKKKKAPAEAAPYRSIACLWRLSEGDNERLEQVTKHPIGWLEHYAFPGWEAECDALYWLTGEDAPGTHFTTAEEERGTPEKIDSMLSDYEVESVLRLGDWPRIEVVNTPEQIVAQLKAVSALASAERTNRHFFDAKVSPRILPSWHTQVEGFLDFISFEDAWQQEAARFLSKLEGKAITVHLDAFDKKHFFYALHQARTHPNAALSSFEIRVEKSGTIIEGLRGYWAWDGKTCPSNARATIKRVYGSENWAVMSLFSAMDEARYEAAFSIHGFSPAVEHLVRGIDGQMRSTVVMKPVGKGKALHDFVVRNHRYVETVSKLICQFGDVPTSPGSTGPVELLFDPGDES